MTAPARKKLKRGDMALFVENIIKPAQRRMAKPKGWTVSVEEQELFPDVYLSTGDDNDGSWLDKSAARKMGWRPSKKPRKWVFTCEPAEE